MIDHPAPEALAGTARAATRTTGTNSNTDLFICECCFYETRLDFHLDYPRIAENRHRFGCRRLVLTHVGREVLARRDDVRDEIAYDGLTVEV